MSHSLVDEGASRVLLARLLEPVSPASFEDGIATVVAEIAGAFATVTTDRLNSIRAVVNPGGRPRVGLVAHVDEIGMIVRHVDEAGRLWLGAIGILDPSVLLGQRVIVLGAHGRVPGVIGHLPPHLGVGAAAPGLDALWVDIGASCRDEALRAVAPGDPLVLDAPLVWLMGERLTARALDNRLGVLVALRAAHVAAQAPGLTAEVALLATTREETSCGGAAGAVASYAPEVALIIDCTFASDVPVEGFERRVGLRPLGSGPSIARGGPHVDRVARELVLLARAASIPYTIEAEGTRGGTDADAVHALAGGIPCGGIGIPVRHLHSPAETADLRDVRHSIDLVSRFCVAAGDRHGA